MTTSPNTPPHPDGAPHPIYKWFDQHHIANLSNEHEMDIFWSFIYQNKHIKNYLKDKTPKEILSIKLKFNHVFAQTEYLFGDKKRSSGDPYFFHLLETAFIRLDVSYDGDNRTQPDVIDVLYALLHDVIEDTQVTYTSIQEHLWNEIAFGVHLISKRPFNDYIKDKTEMERYIALVGYIWAENIDMNDSIIDESIVDRETIQQYNTMRTHYRIERNKKHFWNYDSFDTFYKYAQKQSALFSTGFCDERLREICERILQIKLCDRLHNLKTLCHMSVEKIERKVEETEKYFMKLAREINPVMAEKMAAELQRLKEIIKQRNIQASIKTPKQRAHGIIENSECIPS